MALKKKKPKLPSQRDRGYYQIKTLLIQIMATQQEDAQALRDIKDGLAGVSAQLTKATNEINDKIAALTAASNNATITPELQSAIDDLTPAANALKPIAQTLDDIVPDVSPVPPPQAKHKHKE